MASNGQHLKVTGVRTVRLPLGDGFLELTNAQFAPQAEVNMISPGLLRRGDVIMDGRNDQLVSADPGLPVNQFKWKSNISTLVLRDEQTLFNFAAINSTLMTKQVEFGLLHKRLVHAGKDRIVKACKNAGIAIDPRSIFDFQCPACLLAEARTSASSSRRVP
ncbi:hypothetical protein E4U17_001150 [Claviceps sp. LM77 group G4]|nr:hypothetical protein E4U17_001150 [Claviceps sp. LM77 group G4]KAG6078448.1 hypothetical protein E4U33_000714 [Claviceps sp. LM78 group G4]KAG6078733.1 hypothetical protein E4U16_001499 [Claviceps sp. LM84 group G4]